MAMLDMLLQLRKQCGHVRYTGTVRGCYDHGCLVVKLIQRCGHVRRADTAEAIVWLC